MLFISGVEPCRPDRMIDETSGVERRGTDNRKCLVVYKFEMRMKAREKDSVRFEILRVQTHFEIERLIEQATEMGFGADDAIDALEQALDALRSCHSSQAKYPKTPRLF